MASRFIKHYGERQQNIKLAEECIELLLAYLNNGFISLWFIIKILWFKRHSKDITEEQSDVYNLLQQFEEYYGDGRYFNLISVKRDRQLERINNESN